MAEIEYSTESTATETNTTNIDIIVGDDIFVYSVRSSLLILLYRRISKQIKLSYETYFYVEKDLRYL